MSRHYAQHGPGYDDAGTTYAPVAQPDFTVESIEPMIDRLGYELAREASDASIHINRLLALTERTHAKEAARDLDLIRSMDDCILALRVAIENLTGEA